MVFHGSSNWMSSLVLCSPLARGRYWVWSGPTKIALSSKCNADGFRVKFHFPSKMHTDTHTHTHTHPQNPLSKSHTNPMNRCAFAPELHTKRKVMKKIQLHPCLFVPAVLFRSQYSHFKACIYFSAMRCHNDT